MTRHHRKCKSNGGTNEDRNISVIPSWKHRCWHLLFNNREAPNIARYINNVFLDPDWELVARRKGEKTLQFIPRNYPQKEK